MPKRKSWDDRRPPKDNLIKIPGNFDAWVVGTFNRIAGISAFAWELRRRGEDQPACPPGAERSDPDSESHRPFVAALVDVVQTLAPSSSVNFICALEWPVNIINGEYTYNKHADIWEAFERWKGVRDISCTASTKSGNHSLDKEIFSKLKELATKTRKSEP